MSHENPRVAWLPYANLDEAEARTGGLPDGVRVDCFLDDGSWPDSLAEVEFLVVPYLKGPEVLRRAEEMTSLQVVQTLTAGVENYVPKVPDGVQLCNAAGVHDASTAEMALALALASGRHLDVYARQQSTGTWKSRFGSSLASERVL